MNSESLALTAAMLDKELAWLDAVLQARVALHFGQPCGHADISDIPEPHVRMDASAYANLVHTHSLTPTERLILVLALAPECRPALLDVFLLNNQNFDRGFSEFGGMPRVQHMGFLPTGETALFLTAGDNMAQRTFCQSLLSPGSTLRRLGIVQLDDAPNGEPVLSGRLRVSKETLQQLFSSDSQASVWDSPGSTSQCHTTGPDPIQSLVLDAATFDQLGLVKAWMLHQASMRDQYPSLPQHPPGLRVLFHGAAGTGRQLAVQWVAQQTCMRTVCINPGHTAQSLVHLIDLAKHKNHVLWLDADDSDWPVSEVRGLLRWQLDDFPGLLIVIAKQEKDTWPLRRRRFDLVVPFKAPGFAERVQLWHNCIPKDFPVNPDITPEALAERFQLDAVDIQRVVRSCALQLAAQAVRTPLTWEHIQVIVDQLQ